MRRQQMPLTTEFQLTVEKTPSYFVTKLAPGRIRNMTSMPDYGDRGDDLRLIVVVRDPVTRAVSDYTQAVAKRPDLPPFERLAFVASQQQNPTPANDDEPAPQPAVDTSWGAIKIGLYARHLERWLRHFRRDRIHFVHGERLVTDPAGELALVENFLGLRRLITADWFYFNSTKGFPCLRLPLPFSREPAAEADAVSPSLPASSDSWREQASANDSVTPSLRCLGKTKGRTHPTIDETVLQRLRDFYRPFNEKFYRMTGIDFDWS
jgi:hypothetical protein